MEATELVLKTMHEAGTPLNAGKIAELSGLDRKVVDKAMKELKATSSSACGAASSGTTRWPRP